jgi:CHAT domain-containing protein
MVRHTILLDDFLKLARLTAMRSQTLRLTTVFTLCTTLTISDFLSTPNQSALAQTPSSQKAEVDVRQSASTPPTVEAIKRIAKEHQATLVSYSIIYDQAQAQGEQTTQESVLYIWVVPPTGEIAFRQVDLKSLLQCQGKQPCAPTSLANLVTSTRESIELRYGRRVPKAEKRQVKATLAVPKGRLEAVPREEKRQTKGLQQLYQLLIQPIADLLPSNPNARVVFIPQDSLFLVPFAALQDSSGKYLIEQHSILTAPSIQVLDLTRQQRQRVANGDILIVGNPSMPSIPARPGEKPQPLPNLPGAQQEALAIAQLFNTQALIGKDATKAAVLQRMPGARIIHLATNAIVDEERGTGSALALAPDPSASGTPPYQGGDRGGSGWLTAEEIQNLKLNAELVVLSGCDTGLGKITGDGVIGLARSFISAGASSVIVSLGNVSDEATAFLMTEFYRHLQQNQDKAQSLRSAMLATMKKYPNYRDWGAFTLIGEAQ